MQRSKRLVQKREGKGKVGILYFCINLQRLFVLGILILVTACPLHHQHWLNCYGHQQGMQSALGSLTRPLHLQHHQHFQQPALVVLHRKSNKRDNSIIYYTIGHTSISLRKASLTLHLQHWLKHQLVQQPALSSLFVFHPLVIRKSNKRHRLNYLLYDRAYVDLLEEDLPAEYEPELQMALEASLATAERDFSM